MSSENPLLEFEIRIELDRFQMRAAYSGSSRSLGVFGASGCGKTTLLECLAGLRKRVEGKIAFSGDVWLDTAQGIRRKAMGRDIGYVPQDHLLFPRRSVRSNLLAGKSRLLRNGMDIKNVFENVVSTLELGDLLDSNVERLSGGERQRVALGRALCSGPKLLLLDEPLASLDASLRWKILPYLILAKEDFNLPMVVVSHDPTELQAVCDETIVLSEGEVIGLGPPQSVFAKSEVFDLAREGGFENVLSGIVVRKCGQTDLVRLEGMDDRFYLRTPATGLDEGRAALFAVAPDDLLLSVSEPVGLSARNCLPARVASVKDVGSRIIACVEVSRSIESMVVELTEDAVETLDIRKGRDLFLVFKTNSVRNLV